MERLGRTLTRIVRKMTPIIDVKTLDNVVDHLLDIRWALRVGQQILTERPGIGLDLMITVPIRREDVEAVEVVGVSNLLVEEEDDLQIVVHIVVVVGAVVVGSEVEMHKAEIGTETTLAVTMIMFLGRHLVTM